MINWTECDLYYCSQSMGDTEHAPDLSQEMMEKFGYNFDSFGYNDQEYRNKSQVLYEFQWSHPKTEAYRAKRQAHLESIRTNNFCALGLSSVGVLLEIEMDGKLHRLLIGDVCEDGGDSSDSLAYYLNGKVKRYARIYDPTQN